MKVLVAEDNADNRALINDVLQMRGHEVLMAHNGREALALAQETIPDLVILDINMPEMDGFEVCSHLKASEDTNEIPILMLTALGGIDDRVKGLGLGADDYLTKPFSPRELIARIDTRLRAKVNTDQLRATQQLVRQTFERFVPSEVVEQLIANPEQVRLGGQLQEVTALFADLEGFTSLSENIPPEQVIDILNQYMALIVGHVKAEGGTIDKFLGDGLLALYNAPLPQENHPFYAVRTAVMIKQALETFYTNHGFEPGFRLKINFGIHTGEAVVGNVGTADIMDYTAIGDTVNLASRLEGVSKGGQIIVSQAVYNAISTTVEAVSLGPHKVKGREEPVLIYEVTGIPE